MVAGRKSSSFMSTRGMQTRKGRRKVNVSLSFQGLPNAFVASGNPVSDSRSRSQRRQETQTQGRGNVAAPERLRELAGVETGSVRHQRQTQKTGAHVDFFSANGRVERQVGGQL